MKKSCLLSFLVFFGVTIACVLLSTPIDNVILSLLNAPDGTGPLGYMSVIWGLAAGLIFFFNRAIPQAGIWEILKAAENRKFVAAGIAVFGLGTFLMGALATTTDISAPVSTRTEQPVAQVAATTPTPTIVPVAEITPTQTLTPTNPPTPTIVQSPVPVVVEPTSTPSEPTAQTTEGELKVHFINVGQGDAILITGPGGETVLIDGGDRGSNIVQYLRSQGIQQINIVIATHPHADHIAGLTEVLKSFPVEKVITNGQLHTTLIYEQFLDAIAESQADYVEVSRGDTIDLGDLSFHVLNPISSDGDDLNNGSLVLHLIHGDTSFLFSGDAEAKAESDMLSAGLFLPANILKVGHHGSRSSSTSSFLSKVSPNTAIYSAGRGNNFGHPHAETLAGLASVGAEIFGTDVHGTIVVTSTGNGYSVETEKQGQAQAPPTEKPPPEAQPSQALSVVEESLTSPINAGATATLVIKTSPGAACGITVYYKSGPSEAQGLGPQTADNNGNCSWSWKVGSRTTPGTWRIVVTSSLDGQSVSKEIPFEVR